MVDVQHQIGAVTRALRTEQSEAPEHTPPAQTRATE